MGGSLAQVRNSKSPTWQESGKQWWKGRVRERGRGQVSQGLATQGSNVGFSSERNEEPS